VLLTQSQLVNGHYVLRRVASQYWATKASISLTTEESRSLTYATETLLRLLLPLNDQVWTTFRLWVVVADLPEPVRKPHWAIQSVVATGGVYNIFHASFQRMTDYNLGSDEPASS